MQKKNATQKTRRIEPAQGRKRSKDRERGIKCERCGLHFIIAKNSPVDYVPAHKCRGEKEKCKCGENMTQHLTNSALILIVGVLEDFSEVNNRMRVGFLWIIILNCTLAIYNIALLFLLVNF